jgi:DNA-binding SARP family transcriptional activator
VVDEGFVIGVGTMGEDASSWTQAGGLRVSLLGPLRVWIGEKEVHLGPRQQRTTFAALVMRRGVSMSSHQLVEALWGVDAPATAAAIVRTYIYRLRRILGRPLHGLELIRCTDNGYVIDLPSGALDLDRFEELVGAAGQARESGELAGAGSYLAAALALWSGPPLQGIGGLDAQSRRRHLEAARCSAVVAKIEVELDQGRQAEILAELSETAAQDPLNERLQELLMKALYRCGRRSDALAVHRASRIVLRDELGIDPGPGMNALYEQILRSDPALRRPPTTDIRPNPGTRGGHPLPAELPAPLPTFAGRGKTVRQLQRFLRVPVPPSGTVVAVPPAAVVRAPPVVVISGLAGIGKTSLALYFAHTVASAFPAGQLYADLGGSDGLRAPVQAFEVLKSFLLALGVPEAQVPGTTEQRSARFRSIVATRSLFIVLDNAREADQVRPLLPGTGSSAVVVTSRNRLPELITHTAAELICLGLPSTEEALDMLAKRIGRQRMDAQLPAAREIVRRCGRLPLALAAVGSRAAMDPHCPLSQIAEDLDGPDAFGSDDPSTEARALFFGSYGLLSKDAARAFRLLSGLPGPAFGLETAASLLTITRSRCRALVDELENAGLIVELGPGRYRVHDLLRVYADELSIQNHRPRRYIPGLRA